MASMIASSKNWVEEIEVSEINGEFLMSLMEELQDHYVAESDEKRLNVMIQSLEAEINSSIADHDDQDSFIDSDRQSISDGEESVQSCSFDKMDGCEFSASFDDFDMNEWIDLEELPCSPIHDFDWREMSHVLDDQELGQNSSWQQTCHLVQ